ncbi:hypothetical protein VB715_14470 [Crocosphaera sp. UHCC 0190]|nr:hypothetical protein [Crocosphaera sp. UHCC 0190]
MQTKQIKWKKLLLSLLFWLLTEIFLNFIGLDNLADYSEFIHHQKFIAVCSFN